MLKRKMFLAVMCSLALGAGFISCSGDDSEDTSEVKKTDTPDTPSDVEKPDTPVISEEEKEVEEPSAKIAETPVLLWSYDYYGETMTEQIFDENGEYFGYRKDDKSYPHGIQAFKKDQLSEAEITSASKLQDACFNNLNGIPVFSFDNDGYMYMLTKIGDYICVLSSFKNTADGVEKEKDYDIYSMLKEKFGSGYFYLAPKREGFTCFDGYILFVFIDFPDEDSEKLYFGAVNVTDGSLLCSEALNLGEEKRISLLSGYNDNGVKKLLVLETDDDDKKTLKALTIDFDTENALLKVEGEAETLLENPPAFSDLQIIGDKCYILGSESGRFSLGQKMYSENSYKPAPYYLGDDGLKHFIAPIHSALLKFNLKTKTFENWKNGSTELGAYKFSGEHYEYKYTDFQNQGYEKVNGDVYTFAPLEHKDEYFYKARKIVGRKQDELIIADDGAYFEFWDDKDGNTKTKNCKNINRVVSVNLKDESMSCVDVNVGFTGTVVTGSGYIGIY